MKYIDYERPINLKAALEILQNNGETTKILAGGTDILTKLRIRRELPDLLLDSKEIPELNELSYNPNSGLIVGGAVPLYKLYAHADVKKYYQSIVDSTKIIGGVPIQGRATLGGNLCNAAPSADSIPTLIVLDATASIHSLNGSREVSIREFCTGPGSTILKNNEIVVSINIPASKQNSGAHYMRFIPRNEMDIAVVGVGISVTLENNEFKSIRVALAAVAPTPLFVTEVGDALSGKAVNDKSIELAGDIARNAAKPINDMRGTIEYRKHLCSVLTKRALTTAIERANGGTVNGH